MWSNSRGHLSLQRDVIDAEALLQALLQFGTHTLPLPKVLDHDVRRERRA